MKVSVLALCVVLAAPSALFAQARGRGRGTAAAPAKTTSVRVTVRDADGATLEGVHLTLSGDGSGEADTAAVGTAVFPSLKEGAYRLKAERKGYITLEREFSVKGSVLSPIDLVLNAAPPPPSPPAPPPTPRVAAAGAPGPAVNVAIPDFLDKNYIGRDPIKESVLACAASETVRLLQVRDAIAAHVHDDADEMIYVVAGEGAVRVGETVTTVKAGAFSLVPRGTRHSLERRGKNPIIVMSTLAGAPCTAAQTR